MYMAFQTNSVLTAAPLSPPAYSRNSFRCSVKHRLSLVIYPQSNGWVESALRNKNSMASITDIAIAWMSRCRRWKNTSQVNKGNACAYYGNNNAELSCQACVCCSSHQNGIPRTGSHQLKCPAWGQTYRNCVKPNYLLRVWQTKKPGHWLVSWVWWHISLCRLFNAKSIFIQIICSISNNSV